MAFLSSTMATGAAQGNLYANFDGVSQLRLCPTATIFMLFTFIIIKTTQQFFASQGFALHFLLLPCFLLV